MAQKDQLMHMKNKEDEAEKTAFERFEQELKQTIFGVLFLVLKDEETTLWKVASLMVICELQFLVLIFNPVINYPWKNKDFSVYFKGFFELFLLTYWASLLNWVAYLIIFYVGVFLLVAMVVVLSYAAYLFSHKQFTVMWPFHILRTTCNLSVTVLFYPFIDLFSSMFKCVYENGASRQYLFKDVVCWKEMHILHGTAGVIAFTIFVIICLVVVLCFFETKISSGDPSARASSRCEFWNMLFKTLCNLMAAFFIPDEYRWLNTLVFVVGGIVLYIKQRSDRPYYNDTVNIIADINNGVFLWSAFMLVIVMTAEDSSFDGGIQAFLMGLPLVILLLMTKGDPRQELLLKRIEEYDNGEQWYNKLRYYISFIQKKDMSRDVSVQLKGYIYNHEEKCGVSNCPLKAYIANTTSAIKDKKKKQSKASVENFMLLMKFANVLFSQGVAKFPNCTSLRIAYSFFLKERMGNRAVAISELLAAEKSHPPFDEQFVIYRYRKIIEDEITDVQADSQSGQLDAINTIAYDNYLRQFKEAIGKTAYLHMQFWMEVLEQEPDLGKLDKTGSKIHTAIVQVEDYWAKLVKLNANAPKALKMYADFLIEILNDADAGGELLTRAKETSITRTNFNPNSIEVAELIGTNDFCAAMGGGDGTPCLIAGSEQGQLGEILQFNMAVCRTFGYTKAELSGRKISTLMPETYAKAHDKVLQKCISSNEDTSSTGNRDIFVLARHKSSYLMPIFLQARMISSANHGALFVATLKPDKKGLNVCYLLLNEQQDVVGVSSRCISVLKFQGRLLKNSRVSFQTLAPSIQGKNIVEEYNVSKGGAILDIHPPDTETEEDKDIQSSSSIPKSELITESMQHLESPAKKLRVKARKEILHMPCVISEVSLAEDTVGYMVRLESGEEGKDFAFASKIDKVAKYPNIQFAFDPIEMKYIQQDCLDDAQKRIADETSAYVNIMRDRSHSSMSPSKSDEGPNKLDTSMVSAAPTGGPMDEVTAIQQRLLKRKAYGEGVKTRRLVDGEVVDIGDVKCRLIEKQMEEDEELAEDAKRREGKCEDKKDDIFQSSLKTKKAFNSALNEKSVPSSINKLKKTGYIIVLLVLALAATEFGLIMTEFKDIGENIDMVKYSRLRIAIQMKIVYYISKVVFMVRSTNPRIQQNSASAIAAAKASITSALNEYYDVQNKITLSKLSLSSENSKLYTDKCVSLYYKNSAQQQSNTKAYTLTEAVQQLASEAFSIQSFTSNSNYAVGNDDVDFILYNAFSDLYSKMFQSANLFVDELKSRGTDKQIIVYILYAVALVVCVISVAFLFPVVASVSRTRLDVLSLFFDIPQSSVRVLEKKCEKFVARANDENVDDITSNEGEVLAGGEGVIVEAGEAAESGRCGRHKRKFKNNTTSDTTFYLQFLIAVLVIAGYFSFNFAYGYLFLKAISKYSRELNATTGIHAETAVSFSIYQNLIGNRRILMFNEDQTFNYLAVQEISRMYSIASEVQNSHNENLQAFTEDYQDTFISIMRKSLCDYGSKFNFTFSPCTTFLDGTIIEGLHPVIIHYIEQLREQLTSYRTITRSTTNGTTVNATMTNSFLNGNTISNLETTIFQVVDVSMRYLVDSLISSYKSQYDTEITKRIIIFICFIIAFIIAFMALWTPFVNELNEEIWRTKTMLTLIPYEVCKNIASIKKFLSQQSLFTSKLQS